MAYKVGHAISVEGRNGEAFMTDGSLTLDMREHTPEELFAMAYAACYSQALYGIKEPRNIESAHRVEVVAGVREQEDGKPLYVEIKVAFEDLDEKTALRIAEYGTKVCRYSTATAGNIETSVSIIDF